MSGTLRPSVLDVSDGPLYLDFASSHLRHSYIDTSVLQRNAFYQQGQTQEAVLVQCSLQTIQQGRYDVTVENAYIYIYIYIYIYLGGGLDLALMPHARCDTGTELLTRPCRS